MAPIGKTTGSSAVGSSQKASKGNSIRRSSSGSTGNRVKPANKGPQESSRISADAKKAEKPNAMAEGITKNWKAQGLETSEGNKLGKYQKTGEGTIEKELLKKGFTLKDIYTKDKQGRTLADQVAQANGIKNQKQIADGKELKLPQRPGAQGMSSADLKPNESKTIQAVNGNNSSEVTQKKDANGVTSTDNRTTSDGNSANVRQRTDGVATSSVAPVGSGTQSNTVQHSANREAADQTTVRGQNGEVGIDYKDIDGKKNSVAQRGEGGLQVTNPDGTGAGNQTTIPLGPQNGLENWAQKGDELAARFLPAGWVKPQQQIGGENPIGQIGSVDGVQRRDASSSYNLRQADGNVQQVGQTAAGPLLSVSQSLGNAWRGVKNFFGGGATNPNGGIPAEQIFAPSGAIL